MSNLEEHMREQEELTSLCENSLCDHPECNAPSGWCDEDLGFFEHSTDINSPVSRASAAISAYYPPFSEPLKAKSLLVRHLADIKHLCDMAGWSFDDALNSAAQQHASEAEAYGQASGDRLRAFLAQHH